MSLPRTETAAKAAGRAARAIREEANMFSKLKEKTVLESEWKVRWEATRTLLDALKRWGRRK